MLIVFHRLSLTLYVHVIILYIANTRNLCKFQVMEKEPSQGRGNRRALTTPSRSVTRRRDTEQYRRSHDRSRSPLRVGECDLSASRKPERERDLERELERLRRLESELRNKYGRRSRSRTRRDPSEARSMRRVEKGRRSARREESNRRSEPRVESGRCSEQRVESGRRSIRKSRSRSPTYSTNDLVKILKSLKGGSDSQPDTQPTSTSKRIDHKNILPDFDPSSKNQRINVWLRKVNECAAVYGWDEKTTTHFALQKLQGLAKVWYEGLESILFTWPEWQEKLLSAFPSEQNYGQTLEDMLKRKSRYNEPIDLYYYEKLALLNLCEITGKRAVDA